MGRMLTSELDRSRALGPAILFDERLKLRCASVTIRNELSTQNWSGQGESDSLIKTKHCDGAKA
jgi:hypothetical protein